MLLKATSSLPGPQLWVEKYEKSLNVLKILHFATCGFQIFYVRNSRDMEDITCDFHVV